MFFISRTTRSRIEGSRRTPPSASLLLFCTQSSGDIQSSMRRFKKRFAFAYIMQNSETNGKLSGQGPHPDGKRRRAGRGWLSTRAHTSQRGCRFALGFVILNDFEQTRN
jgi:hypothetical protein